MSGPNPTGRRLSLEHREKLRLAKLGVRKSPAHRAAISAGLHRYWDQKPDELQRRRGFRRYLSPDEIEDFRFLRTQHHYSEAEALRAILREDLIEG